MTCQNPGPPESHRARQKLQTRNLPRQRKNAAKKDLKVATEGEGKKHEGRRRRKCAQEMREGKRGKRERERKTDYIAYLPGEPYLMYLMYLAQPYLMYLAPKVGNHATEYFI